MDRFKVGDRVKFRTRGGWYNGGTIKDIDENSSLIEVDTLGCDQSVKKYGYIQLPYYARVLSYGLIADQVESEVNNEKVVSGNE